MHVEIQCTCWSSVWWWCSGETSESGESEHHKLSWEVICGILSEMMPFVTWSRVKWWNTFNVHVMSKYNVSSVVSASELSFSPSLREVFVNIRQLSGLALERRRRVQLMWRSDLRKFERFHPTHDECGAAAGQRFWELEWQTIQLTGW